jgi:hypothetical protein
MPGMAEVPVQMTGNKLHTGGDKKSSWPPISFKT